MSTEENKSTPTEMSLAECLAGWQRARADYQNLVKEKERALLYGQTLGEIRVLKELLTVYDHFQRALQHEPTAVSAEVKNWLVGIAAIKNSLATALEKMGVTPIVTQGQKFDAHTMEAVSVRAGEGEAEMVAEEVAAGYRRGEEILRPAQVILFAEKNNQ